MLKSYELLSSHSAPTEQQSAREIPCLTCHSRGVTRWGDDCPDCGGMGVVYQ